MKRAITRTMTVVIVVILVIAAVGGVYAYYVTSTPSAPVTPFKLGVLIPRSGTFASASQPQLEGIEMAVNVTNANGGLQLGSTKVPVVIDLQDDETNTGVAVSKFDAMVTSDHVDAVTGSLLAPEVLALDQESAKYGIPYWSAAASAEATFVNGTGSREFMGVMDSSWSIGYEAAAYSILHLNAHKIFFLARSDAWGYDMWNGVRNASAALGGQIVGYADEPLGTTDFTSVLAQVAATKPDVFIFAQFGADQTVLLKEINELGLENQMKIFAGWVTNISDQGVPQQDLNGIYGLHFFYWNLTGSNLPSDYVSAANAFTSQFQTMFGHPPDAYAADTYISTMELFHIFSLTGTAHPTPAAFEASINSNPGPFATPKGPATIRVDHEVSFTYWALVVEGKATRSSPYDLFNVIGYYGGPQVLPTLQSLGYKVSG